MSSTLHNPSQAAGGPGGPAPAAPGEDRRAREYRDNRRTFHRHLVMSLLRLCTLVAFDLGTLEAGRALLRASREGALGIWMAGLGQGFLAKAAVPGPRLALALEVSLLFTGAFRSGELWRQPVRILAGTAVGVTLALYAELWEGSPALVVSRGLIVWLGVGLTLVLVRNALYWVHQRVPGIALGHRVLEIHGHDRLGPTPDLGPGYRLMATLDIADIPVDIEAMEDWLDGGVDTILVSGDLPADDSARVTDFALTHGCRLFVLPRRDRLIGVDPRRVWIRGVPLFQMTAPTLRASHLILKRGMDLVGAALLLVVLSPLLVAVAVAVKLDSPGPVFFRHRRAGPGGRFFSVMKFRSMRADAEELLRKDPALYRKYVENNFKLPEDRDPRVTRVGRILRKSSLDELPQLFNVLKGEMSLVGPRPVVEAELGLYSGRIPTFLSVKPGLTGLWQISGRSNIPFPERADLDLEYVRNWSFLEDLWILLMTVPAVLLRRGAH